MTKLNRQWHLENKMPKNPTLDERIKWHLEHAKNCQCRPLHGKILEEIKKRGLIKKKMSDFSKLKRKRYPVPEYVKEALLHAKVMELYQSRPPYQQNDYIGWIIRAVREETKKNRLNQMIDELKRGNVYMKMKWNPASNRE